VQNRLLMGQHPLQAVLGLNGVGRIETKLQRPRGVQKLKPTLGGVGCNVVGIGNRVAQGEAALVGIAGHQLAPDAHLRDGRQLGPGLIDERNSHAAASRWGGLAFCLGVRDCLRLDPGRPEQHIARPHAFVRHGAVLRGRPGPFRSYSG
jgi:hypothetical protein